MDVQDDLARTQLVPSLHIGGRGCGRGPGPTEVLLHAARVLSARAMNALRVARRCSQAQRDPGSSVWEEVSRPWGLRSRRGALGTDRVKFEIQDSLRNPGKFESREPAALPADGEHPKATQGLGTRSAKSAGLLYMPSAALGSGSEARDGRSSDLLPELPRSGTRSKRSMFILYRNRISKSDVALYCNI